LESTARRGDEQPAGRDTDLETFRVLLGRLGDGRPERSLIYSVDE
jgi:hypothetical protein